MSKNLKCLKQSLQDRGYYVYRIDNNLWYVNGMKLVFDEFIAFGRRELQSKGNELFKTLQRGY